MQTFITKEFVRNNLPLRERDAHKGDFGRLLIVAGSRGMMGACVLCCRSAFRSGAGLVAACCEPEFFGAVHAGVPEATCVPRDGAAPGRYDAIAIGPGLGVSRANYALICRVLAEFGGPVVLDADALNCLAEYGLPAGDAVQSSLVITPHAGEAARLVNTLKCQGLGNITPADVSADRGRFGQLLAQRLNAVCVMKGAGSLVCCPDGRVYENTTGNPGMATGGSGDVLMGMIASLAGQLAAQGAKPCEAAEKAALAGVYLHGLAGDLAAEKWGQAGLMASDLADFAALALHSLA